MMNCFTLIKPVETSGNAYAAGPQLNLNKG